MAAPKGMHIMEGFLPPVWAIVWFVVAIPFWVAGFIKIRRLVADKPESRLLLGLAGAFTFVLRVCKRIISRTCGIIRRSWNKEAAR
jgi:cobalt/nickel transport system permease protein